MRESPARIAAASALALLAAALIVVTTVLPAEYGVDPLGTGAALGLVGLAEPERRILVAEDTGYATDEVSFVLAPFESLEYKYALERGANLLYSWRASDEVLYDFHGEPASAEPGVSESFDRQRSTSAHGAFTAPFTGIHGWFWENRGAQDVTVRLVAAGFSARAIEFRDGRVHERALGSEDALGREDALGGEE